MSGLLSRFTTFLPNTTILSNDHNQELNRIVNLLNGTTTNLKTSLKTSDAGDPPLELDQLSTGPILKGFQGGIEKFRFRNDGSLRTPGIYDSNDNEEILFTVTASAVNEITIANAATGGRPKISATGGDANIDLELAGKGTGLIRLPASNPTVADHAVRKQYVDDKVVKLKYSWFIKDPNDNVNNQDVFFKHFIVPAGTGMRITKFSMIRFQGAHSAGDILTYRLIVNGSGIGSGVSFSDTNNLADTEYSETLNVALSAGDRVRLAETANTGTLSEINVTALMEWEQKLT